MKTKLALGAMAAALMLSAAVPASAQAGDPRVQALEEQVRSLNGKLEELNFLILQTQEQLRKQQEDNEFRFQELEGGSGGAKPAPAKKSDLGTDTGTQTASVPPLATPDTSAAGTSPAATQPAIDNNSQVAATDQQSTVGAPTTLGSIRFDTNGNLIGGTTNSDPVDLLSGTQSAPAQSDTTVAALPATDDPEELYRNSYEFILSGDYKTAEAGFRSYIDRFPSANRVPDANFWLGEALAAQKRHREAAEVFLATSRQYPDSKKAPDTLLKLGISLSALKQREVACATLREVGSRYPKASDALKERVRQELATNGC
ncbi:tol-pal system protein YbgF [Tianweitania aestuarii]|uniref:tol-pal system protein YbgF n=1 Tax=Tianweitania aestuarii TaxID=2814886 RepID=UPI002022D9FF|nr:tol-pal system protein YbgF [Tianweitania aestuarii]